MEKRRMGIPGIGGAGWGEHICAFFYTKDELLKLTVPYIKAGLEDNEFCMWITGDPVTENDALQALEQVLPDAHQYLVNKHLEIFSHSQWYLSSGTFDAELVLGNWVSKSKHAEGKGFAGMRITGNPFWLACEEDWEQFGAYEQAVTQSISNERVLALCTYPIEICKITHVMQTLSSHRSALIAHNADWQRHTAAIYATPPTHLDGGLPSDS
jgi:MEDS: MEthanogen/methylotroph, DcmR Sensory domain